MAKRADPVQVLRRVRSEANRATTKLGRKRLLRLLRDAEIDLTRRLHRAEGLRGPGADSFTATQIRVTLAQIEHVLGELKTGIRDVVVDQGREAADRSVGQLLEYMRRAERKYAGINAVLPIREATMLDRVAQGTEASVLSRLSSRPEEPAAPGILDRYGANTIRKFEERLQLGLATGKPWSEVRAELVEESEFLQGRPGYWAERIVRTETMAAYNRAGWETTREADAALGDMVKILSATFDSRTGWDSVQVHGQIRRPAEAFSSAFGLYQHPPNRPNDREVVVPHRIAWPLPDALQPRSDAEVSARFRLKSKKGSPPARPNMSTVPRERFGQP